MVHDLLVPSQQLGLRAAHVLLVLAQTVGELTQRAAEAALLHDAFHGVLDALHLGQPLGARGQPRRVPCTRGGC